MPLLQAAKLVRRYIQERSSVRDCLRAGLINYSALARSICQSERIEKSSAVEIACRRTRQALLRSAEPATETAARILRHAKLKIRTDMLAVIAAKPRDFSRIGKLREAIVAQRGDFNVIESEEVVVVVTNESNLPAVKKCFGAGLLKVNQGLVQISLAFDRRMETTPGVVAVIYSLLAEQGINVCEEFSCWIDMIILLQRKDLSKALEVLSFHPSPGA